MQHVDFELQITDFAVCNFHIARHALEEEFEQEFLLLVTGIEELHHVFILIRNDFGRRVGHPFQDRFCGVITLPNKESADGLHDVVASPVSQILGMFAKKQEELCDK